MLAASKNPVLVVIDMQNDFVRVGAPLEVASARDTVPEIGRLIAAFRAASRTVIFTRYVADPLYRPLGEKLDWIKLLDAPTHACTPGFLRSYGDSGAMLDGAAVINELTPLPDDHVVDKIYFSAFHATDLDRRLERLGADALVVVGTVTEMCVEDTARHAVHFGYPTVIVQDAVSSNHPAAHHAALEAFARNYGWVVTADAVLDTLRLRDRGTDF